MSEHKPSALDVLTPLAMEVVDHALEPRPTVLFCERYCDTGFAASIFERRNDQGASQLYVAGPSVIRTLQLSSIVAPTGQRNRQDLSPGTELGKWRRYYMPGGRLVYPDAIKRWMTRLRAMAIA